MNTKQNPYICLFSNRLTGQVHTEDVVELAQEAQNNPDAMAALGQLLFDCNEKRASNAAWAILHTKQKSLSSLLHIRSQLMKEAMNSHEITKRRLLLAILERMGIQDIWEHQVDFLDYCLTCMLSPDERPGVRTLCMKLSFSMCKSYPELLEELRQSILLIDPKESKSSIRGIRQKTLAAINEQMSRQKNDQ